MADDRPTRPPSYVASGRRYSTSGDERDRGTINASLFVTSMTAEATEEEKRHEEENGGGGSDDGDRSNTIVRALVFDVDDCLYDVSTGFTAHRNGEACRRFMCDRLGFPDLREAGEVRDEYFERYHSTAKALTVAEREGRFPPMASRAGEEENTTTPRFRTEDLAEYWATNLDFAMLGGVKSDLLRDLRDNRLHHVAFSNGPRKYVLRVLEELGLLGSVFAEHRVFAVDDVLPHCKPEAEAFAKIFDRVGVEPADCVMIEDSMKNIRRAKELGMRTVLVAGAGRLRRLNNDSSSDNGDGDDAARLLAAAAEATKPGDAPVVDDPAVDVAIETVEELRAAVPGLWSTPAVFR